MFLDTNELLLELDAKVHQNNVYNAIQSFGLYDMKDLVIYCNNGEAIFTTKKFLGVFSGLIRDVCKEVPQQETVNLFVPFTKEYVEQMMKYLNEGKLFSRDMENLRVVTEVLQSFGISIDMAEIAELKSRPTKRKKMEEDDNDNGSTDVKEKRKYYKKKKTVKREPGECELDEYGEILNEEKDVKKEKEGELCCKLCDKLFPSQSSYKQHAVVHTKEKKFECPECGKMFGTQAILYNHKGVHNPIKCEHCERTFAQKAAYKNHLKVAHDIES